MMTQEGQELNQSCCVSRNYSSRAAEETTRKSRPSKNLRLLLAFEVGALLILLRYSNERNDDGLRNIFLGVSSQGSLLGYTLWEAQPVATTAELIVSEFVSDTSVN
jgi:hypothetical protein